MVLISVVSEQHVRDIEDDLEPRRIYALERMNSTRQSEMRVSS